MTKRKAVMDVSANMERLSTIHQLGVDWKTRTIWIMGDIEENLAYRYIPVIQMMDESPGPIKVMIASNGGAESGGFAIYDALLHCKNTVITIGYGHVYSIAALIFQAGSTRYLAPNADLMIHNGSLHMEEPISSVDWDWLEKITNDASRNNLRYQTVIAERSGVELHEIDDWCRSERFFSPAEAVEVGLADGIWE